MLTPSEINLIKETAEEFFDRMSFNPEIRVGSFRESTLPLEIELESPQVLIGEKGQTLADIQRLIKAILKRKIQKDFYIDLDINNYKKKKIEYLKELARSAADEVALNKKEKALPSMPAYERRIIHLEVAERENIVTESVGREPERKVVIRPYP